MRVRFPAISVDRLKTPSPSAKALAAYSVSFGRRLVMGHVQVWGGSIEESRTMRMFDLLMTGGIGTSRLAGLKHAPRVCLVADRPTLDVLARAVYRLGQLAGEVPLPYRSLDFVAISPLEFLARLNQRLVDTVVGRSSLTIGAPLSSVRRINNRIARVRWAMICGLTSAPPRALLADELKQVLWVLQPPASEAGTESKRRSRADLLRVSEWIGHVELHTETIPPPLQESWAACRSYWDHRALAATPLPPPVVARPTASARRL